MEDEVLWVYIDDTGLAGNPTELDFLKNSTKSYVAVLFSSEQKVNIEELLVICTKERLRMVLS